MQREKDTTYIATISGGKDSVTMCDLLLKNGYPVNYIVFNDTLIEHDEMYEYIEKLKIYFLERYNKNILVLKPNKKPDDIIFRIVKRKSSKWYGHVKGVFSPVMGFCEWRTESKILPLERFLKQKNISDFKIYLGFTTDEKNRANRDDVTKIYPLIDYFKMSENDCKKYLIEQEMENPLYRNFKRTGCRYCPAQSLKDKFTIWKHYPNVWEEMKSIESRLDFLEKSGQKVIYNNFHLGEKCIDLEYKFKKQDAQKSLFDFSDEPLKDCFCKI